MAHAHALSCFRRRAPALRARAVVVVALAIVASGTFDLQHLGLVVLRAREALDLLDLLEAKRSARLKLKRLTRILERNESHGFGADLADLKCYFAGVDLSADLPNPCGFRVPASYPASSSSRL